LSAFMFSSNTLMISLLTVMCSIDFWFTKNIAGRLLVGLFWERVITVNGEEEFVYQCNPKENLNNKVDAAVFWWGQYIAAGFWVGLLVLQVMGLSFFRIIFTIVPGCMSGFNLYAFYNCSSGNKISLI